MEHVKLLSFVLLTVVLTMVLAACQGIEPPGEPGEPGVTTSTVDLPETTEPSPDPTEAPEPTSTAPPSTEEPAESEGEGLPTEAIWIGLGVLLLFLVIGWLMGRSRKSTPLPAVAAPVVTWKDHTREGYSQARWLYDSLTDDLAVWRGNALFEGIPDPSASAGTSLAATWAQLSDRTDKATNSLYRAEAAAPDQMSAETIRNVITALQTSRSAVDARAEARLKSRGVDGSDQAAATQAANRERLAAGNLTDARAQVAGALTALSAIV
jgi:hypothetical protein